MLVEARWQKVCRRRANRPAGRRVRPYNGMPCAQVRRVEGLTNRVPGKKRRHKAAGKAGVPSRGNKFAGNASVVVRTGEGNNNSH